MAVRKCDGLVREANETKHWEVDNSLDMEFGKCVHFKYHPNVSRMRYLCPR